MCTINSSSYDWSSRVQPGALDEWINKPTAVVDGGGACSVREWAVRRRERQPMLDVLGARGAGLRLRRRVGLRSIDATVVVQTCQKLQR